MIFSSRDWVGRRDAVVFGLISLLTCSGCLQSPTTPVAPESPAAQTAREALLAYADGVANSFDDAAKQLDAGTLKSAVDANRHLQEANAAARKQAFAKVDSLLNDELGGDRWDAAQASELFQDIATGLRSIR